MNHGYFSFRPLQTERAKNGSLMKKRGEGANSSTTSSCANVSVIRAVVEAAGADSPQSQV